MSENQITENKIQLEALSEKFDKMIENIEKLNSVINHESNSSLEESKTTYSIAEVSKLTGLSPMTVQKDINNGILKIVHRGDRKRILRDSAIEYINPKA